MDQQRDNSIAEPHPHPQKVQATSSKTDSLAGALRKIRVPVAEEILLTPLRMRFTPAAARFSASQAAGREQERAGCAVSAVPTVPIPEHQFDVS